MIGLALLGAEPRLSNPANAGIRTGGKDRSCAYLKGLLFYHAPILPEMGMVCRSLDGQRWGVHDSASYSCPGILRSDPDILELQQLDPHFFQILLVRRKREVSDVLPWFFVSVRTIAGHFPVRAGAS